MIVLIWKKIILKQNLLYRICFYCLCLIEIIYKFVISISNFFYDKGFFVKKSNLFIISVGNITLGGSGKTPFVIFLSKLLKKHNKNIAVLSRGYKGGKSKQGGVVSDGKNVLLSPCDAGDEPYMTAKKLENVPVVIGRNRYDIAELVKKEFDTEIGILDDGFQHRKLARDINILLVDVEAGFGNSHVFPAGVLRESLSQIKRADIIVLTKTNFVKNTLELENKIEKYNSKAVIYKSTLEPVCFMDFTKLICDVSNNINELKLNIIKNKNILLVSAIGNPLFFKKQIKDLKPANVFTLEYKDHYDYTKKDIEKIKHLYNKRDIDYIITTHKDFVKLNKFEIDLPLIFLEINIKIKGVAENDFYKKLMI
jgi:tetraacyldisaccharide 4'-kinase